MASDSIVELTVGDVVKATVKNILKDYAIVSFGDIMAYLPSSEYSWGRDNNLKNKLKIHGIILKLYIKSINKPKEK